MGEDQRPGGVHTVIDVQVVVDIGLDRSLVEGEPQRTRTNAGIGPMVPDLAGLVAIILLDRRRTAGDQVGTGTQVRMRTEIDVAGRVVLVVHLDRNHVVHGEGSQRGDADTRSAHRLYRATVH